MSTTTVMKEMPAESHKVRIFSMDKNKSKEKKTDKWSEEMEQLLKKSCGSVENLEAADRDRLNNLFDKIEDEMKKDPSLTENIHECEPFTQEQKGYLVRTSLFMYAQTYVRIVQSVTSHLIGWIDPELNGHYQNIVSSINHLLSLDECKDFPGGFEPFNDNIFPESGILNIGWVDGFAESCVDFLSRAQQFCLDMPTLSGDTSFLQAYVEWLKSKHVLVAKKADEYDKKARHMWRNFEKKHFNAESNPTVNNKNETTTPKESVIPEHKKPTEEKQESAGRGLENKDGKRAKAEAWEKIVIEVVDDDTIKYKANNKKWERANYTELGFLDKRCNKANKLWPIFLGLANKNLPSNIKRPDMNLKDKDIDRIRETLRKFFSIDKLPIKYDRKAKEYCCNFTFNDPRDWTSTLQNEK